MTEKWDCIPNHTNMQATYGIIHPVLVTTCNVVVSAPVRGS